MLLEDLQYFEPIFSATEKKERIIGFKGFDANLKCRGCEYKVGETFTKPAKKNPQPCSADGYHYCKNLLDCFDHYNNNGSNRFCVIEVLGDYTDHSDKSITTSFKILKELSKEDIEKMIPKLERLRTGRLMGLEIVRKLQTKYPLMQVSGSTALFLHGVMLKRFSEGGCGDLDILFPFYHEIKTDDDIDVEDSEDQEDRSGTNDFENVIIIDGKKVDVRIDPKGRYETIRYDGFDYRVTLLEHIMEAKFRYALQGQAKHKKDCYEICGKSLKPKKEAEDVQLPF